MVLRNAVAVQSAALEVQGMIEECVVVGAGPAGLAASRALADRGVGHVVLERDRVGTPGGRSAGTRFDSTRRGG